MEQRYRVPKFGNWETAGDVPYTQYFDNARKGKSGGKLINPNDPVENPEAFSEDASPIHGLPKPKHERNSSREDRDARRPIGYPLPHDAKLSLNSPHHWYGDRVNAGEHQRRASRESVGSERSVEPSPLHPHYHAKSSSRGGVSSPSWERRVSSEGHRNAPNTPGRSRMKNGGRSDDVSERGSTVPKFGAWDESNPASADGFTHIFNKVREEKQEGTPKAPVVSNDSYPNGHKSGSDPDSVVCCCFSFGK